MGLAFSKFQCAGFRHSVISLVPGAWTPQDLSAYLCVIKSQPDLLGVCFLAFLPFKSPEFCGVGAKRALP